MADVQPMAKDPDPNVVLQTLDDRQAAELARLREVRPAHAGRHASPGRQGTRRACCSTPATRSRSDSSPRPKWRKLRKGEAIYQELCYACHGYAGTGMPLDGAPPGATIGPPLAGSRDVLDHRDTIVHILLNGLAGPVSGKDYVAQMVPMDSNNDQWIASIASYVRNSFGNRGTMVSPAEVAKLRAAGQEPQDAVDGRGTACHRCPSRSAIQENGS